MHIDAAAMNANIQNPGMQSANLQSIESQHDNTHTSNSQHRTIQNAIYRDLNSDQQSAVTHFGSPLLILSGAGSGKTKVITAKISHLIEHNGIAAHHIVAVTFTNKAAREMKMRAEQINAHAARTLICTFHSFGARFLRRHGHAAGLANNFSIYDADDSVAVLKSIFPHDTKITLAEMMHNIARAKQYGLSPSDDLSILQNDDIAKYYSAYQNKLDEIGNVDFGDLILKPLTILRNNAAICTYEQENIKVLLVDEYQDTNTVQYKLIQQLYYPDMYLCVVGDDDQSIYAFRGSDVTHIVNFPDYFPNTKTMYLLQNYRSTKHILALASNVIARNHTRHKKVLYTKRTGGEQPRVVYMHDDYEEARYVVSRIMDDNHKSDTAIVYRTNVQSRIFEGELNRNNIAYRVMGGVSFYGREEIKDTIAYLQLVANPRDEIAFKRIINKPARGFGPMRVNKVIALAQSHSRDLLRALAAFCNMGHTTNDKEESLFHAPEEPSRTSGSAIHAECARVIAVVQNARRVIIDGNNERTTDDHTHTISSLADVLQRILEDSGLAKYYEEIDKQKTTFKCANIAELLSAAAYFPATRNGLVEFLEQTGLESEKKAQNDATARVTLITMHNTKGLEFDTVYLVGLQDGIFPRTIDISAEKMEEERRLFYVAITRAKRQLTLTSFRFRHQYGRVSPLPPSRFLSEIDDALVEHATIPEKQTRTGAHSYYAHNTVSTFRSNHQTSDEEHNNDDDVRFDIGMAVFHDDYGSGEVLTRRKDGMHYLLSVRFESGKITHFIEKYAALERIAAD